ncbi:M12 family metallopeptidase [Archangium violaceum]|uniref:Peptidase M12A domain-containing protein n=1 Tax=Archangium violaceum Cb vi76 TaxID=1406225 RepID=A0A084SQB0_9BACT|nr:M12 family metallopeptidase [Archangium violaceum]KFA90645.1 hypothetical protein Q664_27030 [Archangium violaceum Cb vi76]
MGHRLKDDGKKWPGGKIYYDYKLPDTSTPEGGQQQLALDRLKLVDTIEECMERWMRFVNADGITHIQFIWSKDAPVYKVIDLTRNNDGSGSGLNGYDGTRSFYIQWKRQADDHIKSIPHELGHIMGLLHENDRVEGLTKDNPFTGNNPRLCVTAAFSFLADGLKKKRDSYQAVGDYDIWSIMHYPETTGYEWNCDDKQLQAYMDANPDPLFRAVQPSLNYARWKQKMGRPSPLNYPTRQEVEAGLWTPSLGDVTTLRLLYPGPPAQNAQ